MSNLAAWKNSMLRVSIHLISIIYGIDRMDRFEVAVISINWLVLIVNGVLLGFVFKRRLNSDFMQLKPDITASDDR